MPPTSWWSPVDLTRCDHFYENLHFNTKEHFLKFKSKVFFVFYRSDFEGPFTLFAWATVLPPLCQYVKNWAISVDFGDFRPFPASHCFRNILSLGQVLGVKVNSWELKKFWNLAQLTFSTFNFFSWAIFFTKKVSEVRFLISQNPPKLQNFFSLIGAKKRQKRQNV